jgi:type II secretory ATPase GspE/PulE/Tfp pilus assembly ATPase PilB-like protein
VVAEVLRFDERVRQLVHARASNEDVVAAAAKEGFISMMGNAMELTLARTVALAEAEAAVGPMTHSLHAQIDRAAIPRG